MAQRKVSCEVYTDRGIVGKNGVDGKSAYQQAVEGGYQGTEEEFEQALSSDIATVANNVTNINVVGNNIENVNTAVDNMSAIIAAPTAATQAAASASQAATSATNSQTSETNAATSASNAATSATNASASATIATTKASEATSSATSASASATSANEAATSASISAANAEIWAEGTDEQVTTLGGEHSSKVWANVSKQYAESIGAATADTLGLVKPDGNTITVTEDGTISSVGGSGSGFDFEGTKAEFDAAVAAGTITADSVSLITDDVSGDNVATKAELQAVDSSKADTALSNVLANIDYVVESQVNSDGSWYRKYKSGWVEQGGQTPTVAGGNTTTVTLLKPYNNTVYNVVVQPVGSYTASGEANNVIPTRTTTNFIIACGQVAAQAFSWRAEGQGA